MQLPTLGPTEPGVMTSKKTIIVDVGPLFEVSFKCQINPRRKKRAEEVEYHQTSLLPSIMDLSSKSEPIPNIFSPIVGIVYPRFCPKNHSPDNDGGFDEEERSQD